LTGNVTPDVVVGGAPRSGTTYLCELLAKHPQIYVARPFVPEPKVCLTEHPAGDAGLLARYAALFRNSPPSAIKIEKTANYFENENARGRLARILPQSKFIFILREPVARAYSNWLWSRKNGLESLPFADAIACEGLRPSPLPPERAYARPFDYMTRGRYGSLAEAWIHAFGRQRIAFFLFEDAIARPDEFVAMLQDFIGVSRRPWPELRTGRINATDPDESGLDRSLEAALRERITPEVRRFEEVSGIDASVWRY
jgi:Sulfotransferase domain